MWTIQKFWDLTAWNLLKEILMWMDEEILN